MKTVMTIHNLKFQGVWDLKTVQSITGLPDPTILPRISWKHTRMPICLKGGIVYADAITTVSDTYAEEIKTPFYGEGLGRSVKCTGRTACGALSTALTMMSSIPRRIHFIAKNYNAKNFRKEKIKNKTGPAAGAGTGAG